MMLHYYFTVILALNSSFVCCQRCDDIFSYKHIYLGILVCPHS